MPALRVVLDTNVLLSGIAYPASVPGKILGAWKHGALEVVLSAFILDELRRVLPACHTGTVSPPPKSKTWWTSCRFRPKWSNPRPAPIRR